MNKLATTMGGMILPLMFAGCQSGADSTEKIIEKPDIQITDGMFTPEVLELLEEFQRLSPLLMAQRLFLRSLMKTFKRIRLTPKFTPWMPTDRICHVLQQLLLLNRISDGLTEARRLRSSARMIKAEGLRCL